MSREQKSQILKELIRQGITQKELAKQIGVTATTVNNVITGKNRSRRIEIAITNLTGYKFPENQRVPRYENIIS